MLIRYRQLHYDDAIPFIIGTLERAANGQNDGSAYSRYYILDGQSLKWKDVATALAKAMYKAGVVSTPEPRSVATMEDAGEGEVPKLLGSNMLMRGDRARKLGFKVSQPSMLEQVEADLAGYAF